MNIKKAKEKLNVPLREATLCFFVRENKILLGMKKRGFATGKWNGFGGKVEVGESTDEGAVRECNEEVEMNPNDLKLMAVLDCYHESNVNANQRVNVYISRGWTGEPVETDEMKPEWFKVEDLPYDKMWVDDKIWLPMILEGKKVKAEFLFDGDKILDQNLSIVEELS